MPRGHQLVLATPSVGVPHLPYDTAWAFAFCGAALIAYAHSGCAASGQTVRRRSPHTGRDPHDRVSRSREPSTSIPFSATPGCPFEARGYDGMVCSPALVFVIPRLRAGIGRAAGERVRGARFWWRSSRRRRLRSPYCLMLFGAFTAAAVGSERLVDVTGGETRPVRSCSSLSRRRLPRSDRLTGDERERAAELCAARRPSSMLARGFVSVLVHLARAHDRGNARHSATNTSLVAADARKPGRAA